MLRLTTLLTLPLFASFALAQAPERKEGDRPRRERREAPAVELKNFTFEEQRFQSPAVGRELPFGIYLPKGYADEANKDKKWPVVIWLHGMWEDHVRFHERGGAPVLDQTVGDGKLPPCLFVTANGGRTSMYLNRKDERWQDAITVDLLDHLTKNWRASEDRNQRAIMGVSMGGMAALRIAFTNPGLFGTVGAHSSAVFAEDPEQLPERLKSFAQRIGLDEEFGNPIQKEPWQKANPLCITNATDAKVLSTLRIYFDAGSKDRYGFAAGNELLHAALDSKKVPHTWRMIEGGGHSWGADFQDKTLPYSFAFVGETFLAGKPKAEASAGEPAADKKGAEPAKKGG